MTPNDIIREAWYALFLAGSAVMVAAEIVSVMRSYRR